MIFDKKNYIRGCKDQTEPNFHKNILVLDFECEVLDFDRYKLTRASNISF